MPGKARVFDAGCLVLGLVLAAANLLGGVDLSAAVAGILTLYGVAALSPLGASRLWGAPRIVVFLAVVFLGNIELLSRFLLPQQESREAVSPGAVQFVDDPELLYRFAPGFSFRYGEVERRANSLGFMDSNFTRQRTEGKRRALVLTDSLGVESCSPLLFPDRLEELAGGWEVYNLAAMGYNTLQVARNYELHGTNYEHDLVIVLYCINDVYPYTAIQGALQGHLKSIDLLRRRWPSLGRSIDDTFRALYADRENYERLVVRGLERIQRQAQASGAEVRVYLMPLLDEGRLDLTRACLAQVRVSCNALGLEAEDLTEPLREAGLASLRCPATAGQIDFVHPNAKGHALLAELMAADLGR